MPALIRHDPGPLSMRRFIRLTACLILAASTLNVLDATGAPLGDATPPAAPVAASAAAVEPISSAEIPMRADVDERFIQERITQALQVNPAKELAPRLGELTAGTLKLSGTFKRDELRTLPAIRLESLERHWMFYDAQLAEWRGKLQRITASYSDSAAELGKRRAVWEATRAAGGDLAPALVGRVDSMLREIALAEKALSVPLGEQLNLARRGNLVQQSVDAGMKGVAAAIDYHDRRLFMIDSPPLWKEWTNAQPSTLGLSTLQVGLQIESDFQKEYEAANQRKLRVLHIAALLLLPLIIWISRRTRKLVSDDPEMRSSVQVLLRPISSWLVVVFMSVLFLEPHAPIIRHQSALLLALVPVLRLLPGKVFTILGPWPYVATGLYLLGQLSFLFVGVPLLHRLYVLLIGLLTLVSVLWLLLRRRSRGMESSRPTQFRTVRVFGWLAAAALATALLANLLGNTSLAEMLTDAVLTSGYLGLALYAGAAVLSAIIALLLTPQGVTRFKVVQQHAGPLLQAIGRLVNVVAVVSWVLILLNEFRVYRPIAEWTARALSYPIAIGEISLTLGSVLLFLASLWVAFWIARTIRVVLRDDVLPNMQLPRGVSNSVSTLTYYGVLVAGVMIALAAAGFHMSELAFVVGALSVGIGFGLQNVVNNFVSGLILMFERPIQPGDVIDVSGTSGKVRNIGMRATTLETFEGADVVVPNGTLLSEKLINWTLSDTTRRLEVNVGVAYGTDPHRVLALLEEVARSTPGVLRDPSPMPIFVGFGASSLDFAVRAWISDYFDSVVIKSALTVRVHDALKDAGIAIPFPQRDLHLRSVSPEALAGLGGRRPA
jgi:small-conductance mechanosensitive channel